MHRERPQTSPPNRPKESALSLILCSRNDQYMGNSRWRLQTALNYLAHNVHALGREDDVEVVVTDWGSEIPLHTVLQLSPIAAGMVSFVVVPPALAQKLQGDSPFSEVHALNAAARRAGGQYIGRMDQDILVGKRFLTTFFELCEGTRQLDMPLGSALLFANRRSIPYRFAVRCPSLWAVDRFIHWFGRFLPVENHLQHKPHLFYCSYVGMWLLHRDLWYECGGYDEKLIYMNEMESDMAARLMEKKYKMVNLGELTDYGFYHLTHYHPRAVYQAAAHRKVNLKRWHERDEKWSPTVLHPNSDDWGLIRYPLEVPPCSSISSNRMKTPRRSQTVLGWTLFALLLLTAGTQMLWDRLVRSLKAAPSYLIHFPRVWGHRATVAWQTVCGQPPISWPRLLAKLWVEKRHNRSRQQKR